MRCIRCAAWRGCAGGALVAYVSVTLFALAALFGAHARAEVSGEVFITDPGPDGAIDANNSPAAVVNPQDPNNVVVVHRVDAPAFSARLHWSIDRGATWSATTLALPDGTGDPEGPALELGDDGEVRFVDTQRPYAPDVAFGPDGTLYVTYVNLMGRGNVPDNLWLARSEDGGKTLSDPVRVAGDRVYQARLVVDPEGVIHITYLQADDIAVWALPSPPTLVAVRSEDGGKTFADPVVFSDPDRPRVAAASPVIDAASDLVVLYQDFKDNVRDFQNLEGPPWEGPGALVLTRSSDGGRSFSRGVEVDDEVVVGQRFIVFLPEFPSIAAAPDGALYVAWADARTGSRDVLLRRSIDGGRTWEGPVRVNDNPARDGTSQYLPALAANIAGRLDVLYLDRRDDPDDVMTAVTLATSTDGGVTFGGAQVSSQHFDATIGPRTQQAHTEPDVGSRLGLVAWHDRVLAVWADTRIGHDEPELARQDVVAGAITVAEPAASERGLGPVLGVLIALLAVGLLAIWRYRPRRR